MKVRRVLVLMHEALVPPDTAGGTEPDAGAQWKMEYELLNALARLGHEAIKCGVGDELRPIREAIDAHKPHIAFNLLMHFHDAGVYDSAIVSFLELTKLPYTGCNARGLLLAGDKALSKKVLTYHRIRVPQFAVFPRGHTVRRAPAKLRFPLFVKSTSEHSSSGIAQASIVRDVEALKERVAFVHRNVGTAAITEEYIEGRELTIGVLGNQRLVTFPVWEMTFDSLPNGAEPIATSRMKWDRAYQKRVGLRTGPADISDALAGRIATLAKRIYKALDLSGYARIDLRLDAEERVWVLEANPNPDLSADEDFMESAAKADIGHDELVDRIVALGLAHEPAWKV